MWMCGSRIYSSSLYITLFSLLWTKLSNKHFLFWKEKKINSFEYHIFLNIRSILYKNATKRSKFKKENNSVTIYNNFFFWLSKMKKSNIREEKRRKSMTMREKKYIWILPSKIIQIKFGTGKETIHKIWCFRMWFLFAAEIIVQIYHKWNGMLKN